MNLKKKKFYNLTQFFTLFNKSNKAICLFAHVNNSNILETNQIKLYCDANNIKTKYIKIGLLKKLTKNSLLLNILTGPTQLFFFTNIQSFYNFSQSVFFNTKIYPLTIYFNETFFNYLFFYNYIKNKINSFLKKENNVHTFFVYNIRNSYNSVLIIINKIWFQFWQYILTTLYRIGSINKHNK